MNDLYCRIKKSIETSNSSKILVHSDLLRGFRLQLAPNGELLDAHCKLLIGFAQDIYMPTFNYDFPKTRTFDVANTPSKIGVINEYFRTNYAQWQTPIPVFSVAGTGNFPVINCQNEIDPFDDNSIFGFLHKTNSLIMYYGAGFSSTTLIHYVERISNLLYYRYDKIFEGEVIYNGINNKVNFKFHVRPMDKNLDYNWTRLENDLKENNLIKYFDERATKIKIIRVIDLVDFWMMKMKKDPLYFLDDESKIWVEPLLNKLGRPFLITDFE